MNDLIYSSFRSGKVLRQIMKWQFLKCKDFDCELILTDENEYEAVKICPECGKKHLLIKKIRK